MAKIVATALATCLSSFAPLARMVHQPLDASPRFPRQLCWHQLPIFTSIGYRSWPRAGVAD